MIIYNYIRVIIDNEKDHPKNMSETRSRTTKIIIIVGERWPLIENSLLKSHPIIEIIN